MAKRLTTKEFIEKAKKVHGERYDYSLVQYKNTNTLIDIVCPTHGIFQQKPTYHLDRCGCQKCGEQKLTTDSFIEKSKLIHGDRYNYRLVKYGKNNVEKVEIICSVHGLFKQGSMAHLKGQGCPKCCDNTKRTIEEFINESRLVHGDKYIYDKTVYTNKRNLVTITCPTHGDFQQKAESHIDGYGCKVCRESKLEKKVRIFLTDKKIEYEYQKKFPDLRDKFPLSIDFYLPNEKIAIECNGIQHYESIDYFGGTRRFKAQQRKDQIKVDYCKKENITLIIISYLDDVLDVLNVKVYPMIKQRCVDLV